MSNFPLHATLLLTAINFQLNVKDCTKNVHTFVYAHLMNIACYKTLTIMKELLIYSIYAFINYCFFVNFLLSQVLRILHFKINNKKRRLDRLFCSFKKDIWIPINKKQVKCRFTVAHRRVLT